MKRLLFVARPSVDKGLHVLIEALEHMRTRNWTLTIVGEIAPEHAIAVKGAQTEGRPIICVGPQPLPNVAEYMRAADILVVPSIYETFGNVALEGMASGCVVIASRTGGLISLVENGRTGWLTRAGDAVDLAIAIDISVSQSSWAETAREAGLEKAQAYSWDVISRKTLRLVRSLIIQDN